MRTRNYVYILGISLVTLLISLSFLNLAFLILTLSALALLAVGVLGTPPRRECLGVERDRKEVNVYEDDEVEVSFTVSNEGEKIRRLEVMDQLPSNIDIVEGSNHHLIELEKGEKKSIDYKIKFMKGGTHRFGPVKLRFRDPLELFAEEWKVEKYTTFTVMPKSEDLSRTKIRPKYTRNWLGNIKSKQIGIGSEFFSIREYVPGDEMRRINWKATARYLTPMANEFEGEKSGDIIIVVDGFKESNVGDFERNTLRNSVRAATSLASDLISDQNRVGLLVLGEVINWVYPKASRDQIYRIMNHLMGFESGSIWRLEHAKYVLKKIFPNRCLLLFISPLTNQRITDTLVELARREYDVMVLSPSPLPIEEEVSEKSDEMAKKLLLLERDNRMEELRDYGPVIDWDTRHPLESSLQEVRRYLLRRHR